MFSYQTKEKERTGTTVQPKLKIGQPGDKYEREADAVADRVMRMSESDTMQMQPEEDKEEMIQPKLKMQPISEVMMQPMSKSDEDFVSPEIVQQMNSSKGGGQSLPTEINQFMSNAFGKNFSSVKIHTDSKAVQMNQQMGAQAFTMDNDIYFNDGNYDPETKNGTKLLAHELVHTVQQGQSDPLNTTNVIQRSEENTGTVETSAGVEEIEGMEITAPTSDSIRERLVTRESEINERIQGWVEDGVGDLRDGIQEAGSSFNLWFSSLDSEPNTAEFVLSVASAAIGVIGTLFPPAGVATGIVGAALSVVSGPISRQLDPNAEPQAQAQQLQQNMIALSGQIDRAFDNYGTLLKASSHDQWSNIGIALTMEQPCIDCAQDELFATGVPRVNQNYGQLILSNMIYTYLDWKQMHDINSSTFFISSDSVEYAFFTEDFRRRLRERANIEAEERLGD